MIKSLFILPEGDHSPGDAQAPAGDSVGFGGLLRSSTGISRDVAGTVVFGCFFCWGKVS